MPENQPQAAQSGPIVQRLVARPLTAVLTVSALQIVVWTVLPYLASSAPPLDVVEGLVWGREWLLGTHKHPTLQAWLVELSFQVTGDPIFGPYLLSQISVTLTYLLMFLTGSLLMPKRHALIGVLLSVPVVYFTWLTTEFNHNVLQMPVWAGAIYLFTLARRQPTRARPWLALGVVCGIGLYVKYSVVVLYVVLAIWTLIDAGMRRALLRPWPWLAIGVALLVWAPHLVWLVRNDFLPLTYAASRGGEASVLEALRWLAVQAIDHLPLLPFFLFVGFGAVRRLPREAEPSRDVAYAAFLALGPALLTVLLSAALGIGLRDMWGMPMFTLSGPLIVLLLRRHWSLALSARALVVAVCAICLLAIVNSAIVATSPRRGHPMRAAWPMHEIAERAEAAWAARTDAPLEIVAGPMWLAGLVAVGSPQRPSVLYYDSLALSPWLSEEDLARDGVLYVWEGKSAPKWMPLPDVPLEIGSFAIEGTRIPDGTVGYAVRLPQP